MISNIRLVNFRNYDECQAEFSPGFNCIVGNNGQGKTNLLEAVYYLSLLRSFRTSDINEMRQWTKDRFMIHGVVPSEPAPPIDLSVTYGAERRLMVNKALVYRASDFINKFVCVSFIPQDLSLVQGTPSHRRRFLDISVSQISSAYLRHLQAYMEALRSRNIMLKDMAKYTKATITAYDSLMAREAAAIEYERRVFVKSLNRNLSDMSYELLGDDRVLSIKYMSRIGSLLQELDKTQEEMEAFYLESLEKSFERDCMRGTTEYGPHRSDFSCLLGNVRMQDYSSQGECRLASLALRLACLDIIEKTAGSGNVTLVIDDVVGELDSRRRSSFFKAVSGVGQTLFACTDMPERLPDIGRLFKISGGKITAG